MITLIPEYFLFLTMSFLIIFSIGCSSAKKSTNASTRGARIHASIVGSDIPWETFAQSAAGRDILMWRTGSGNRKTLIFGGFHGNEFIGAELVLRYAEYLFRDGNTISGEIVIIPALNPDGLILGTRTNQNGVDVNRNFPTENWQPEARRESNYPGPSPSSEPETKAAIQMVESFKPDRIISVHAPLRVVNFDGPARTLAETMSVHTGYPVSDDIGYPTPGSFGTYAGRELNIPVITLEVPDEPLESIWASHRDALDAAIQLP